MQNMASSRRDVHVVLLVNFSHRMRDASVLSLARHKARATGFRFPRCQGPGVLGSLGPGVPGEKCATYHSSYVCVCFCEVRAHVCAISTASFFIQLSVLLFLALPFPSLSGCLLLSLLLQGSYSSCSDLYGLDALSSCRTADSAFNGYQVRIWPALWLKVPGSQGL